MNKSELVNAISTKADLTKKDAAKAVDALFEIISNTLAKEDTHGAVFQNSNKNV
jgi:DNA-binding protein HU-beta